MTEWKVLGAVLVVAGSAGLGMGAAARQKKRLEDCRQALQLLLLLKSELSCTGACLEDAFRQIGGRMPEGWKNFLIQLSGRMQEMQTGSLAALWSECCREFLGQTCLSSSDLQRVSEFGKHLGYPDLQLQLKLLDLDIQEQERVCSQIAEELPEKCRISRTLGIFGGIMLAVMLI